MAGAIRARSGGSSPSVSLLEELRRVVGPGSVITDPDRLLVYESDGLTQYRMLPSAVVLPGTGEELREVVAALGREGQPFVVRGAGTGLSGGALAVDGAVVIGTARLNRILEVDPATRTARVEPGVVNAHLTRATLPHGLIYAPDPSSQSACTLGGNVAENSGGPHCLKYGVTSRYVTGLRVVLPDGSVAWLGGMGREEVGLDLTGLFVGSEGCFGVATEIQVSLVPASPAVRTLLALFETVEAAGEAVTAIMARGLLPAALEIVDRETIRAVEASAFAAGYPTDVAAALVVEFDGIEEGLDAEAALAEALCLENGAREVRRAADESDRSALWQGRKKAFGAMGRIAPDLLVQDATVPRSRLPAVLEEIGEIGRRYRLTVANVFHAGDGNLHPNLLFDRRDPDELSRVEAASAEIMEVCIRAGGTITGEHGVGLDKRKYMPRILSPAVLRRMAEVKAVFDPAGICNPGKVLPDDPPPSTESGESDAGPAPPMRPEAGSPEAFLDQMEEALGPGGVVWGDGGITLLPASLEESVVVLRTASAMGVPLRPVGRGMAPRGEGREGVLNLSSLRLRKGPDHAPEDLRVEMDAGFSLGEANGQLAGAGHWLPMDPPGGPEVTLGGAVATGRTGPLAMGYGRLRDHLLGLTLVDGTGEILELGGRVVKNVAGFDLVRLTAGSRGVLGFITSVTLRVFPVPATDETLLWEGVSPDRTARLRRGILAAGMPVAALEVGWKGAGEGDREAALVATRLLGSAERVHAMRQRVEQAVGGASQVLDGDVSQGWWRRRSMNLPSGMEAPPPVPGAGATRQELERARTLEKGLKSRFDPAGILPSVETAFGGRGEFRDG